MVMSGKNKHYAVLGLGRFGMSVFACFKCQIADGLACLCIDG